MNDRGEKIINLAREMLRTDMTLEPEAAPVVKSGVSFKVLCLATILTAIGGSAVTHIANEARRPINRYEKIELKALIFYAAKLKSLDEASLRRDVEQQLGLASFDDMNVYEYQIARRYLQDKAL